MEIDVGRVDTNCVIKFLSQQQYLESVKCRIITRNLKEFISSLFVRLLTDCPRLSHVQLSSNHTIYINCDFFSKLISSSLETFCLQCSTISLHPDIHRIVENLEICNSTLRTLHIIYGMDQSVHLAFLNAFRNLKFLELHEITDTVLQVIWKYQVRSTKYAIYCVAIISECLLKMPSFCLQTNLVSLKLFDCEYTSEFGFTGQRMRDSDELCEGFSIQRLQSMYQT